MFPPPTFAVPASEREMMANNTDSVRSKKSSSSKRVTFNTSYVSDDEGRSAAETTSPTRQQQMSDDDYAYIAHLLLNHLKAGADDDTSSSIEQGCVGAYHDILDAIFPDKPKAEATRRPPELTDEVLANFHVALKQRMKHLPPRPKARESPILALTRELAKAIRIHGFPHYEKKESYAESTVRSKPKEAKTELAIIDKSGQPITAQHDIPREISPLSSNNPQRRQVRRHFFPDDPTPRQEILGAQPNTIVDTSLGRQQPVPSHFVAERSAEAERPADGGGDYLTNDGAHARRMDIPNQHPFDYGELMSPTGQVIPSHHRDDIFEIQNEAALQAPVQTTENRNPSPIFLVQEETLHAPYNHPRESLHAPYNSSHPWESDIKPNVPPERNLETVAADVFTHAQHARVPTTHSFERDNLSDFAVVGQGGAVPVVARERRPNVPFESAERSQSTSEQIRVELERVARMQRMTSNQEVRSACSDRMTVLQRDLERAMWLAQNSDTYSQTLADTAATQGDPTIGSPAQSTVSIAAPCNLQEDYQLKAKQGDRSFKATVVGSSWE